jgi:hypothetical protein
MVSGQQRGGLGMFSPSQALPGPLLSYQVCVRTQNRGRLRRNERGLRLRVSDSAMIDKPERRRFPPPWYVDEADPALDWQCFIVRDANGQALAYVYLEGS